MKKYRIVQLFFVLSLLIYSCAPPSDTGGRERNLALGDPANEIATLPPNVNQDDPLVANGADQNNPIAGNLITPPSSVPSVPVVSDTNTVIDPNTLTDANDFLGSTITDSGDYCLGTYVYMSTDTDCDGILNTQDDFPNDSTLGICDLTVPEDANSIQNALNISENGNLICVKEGLYKENINFYHTSLKNIGLYCLDQSISADEKYSCTIDGDYEGRVISFNADDPNFMTSDTVLSGFNIQNGYSESQQGIGIYIKGVNPTLKNLRVENNESVTGTGGGIFIEGNTDATLSNIIIKGNKAKYAGGLSAKDVSNFIADQLSITQNEATGGDSGGLRVKRANGFSLSNSVISSNKSFSHGGGSYIDKGENISFDAITVSKNIAYNSDGVAKHGAGFYMKDPNVVSIRNSTFSENHAKNGYGGGIFLSASYMVVENSSFIGNTASNPGGGLDLHYDQYFDEGSFHSYSNVLVMGNHSGGKGGGIYISQSSSDSIMLLGTNLSVINNTTDGSGGGIEVNFQTNASTTGVSTYGIIKLFNSIIQGNISDLDGGGSKNGDNIRFVSEYSIGASSISYSNIDCATDKSVVIGSATGTITTATTDDEVCNTSGLYIDADSTNINENNPNMILSDGTLDSFSASVDTGSNKISFDGSNEIDLCTNKIDLSGEARCQGTGSVIDMGAFEQ